MPKRCPDCHRMNEDGHIFCSFCGEPLDANVRLIKGLEKEVQTIHEEEPAPRTIDDDDDYEYIPPVKKEKKKSSAPLLLGLLAVAIAVAVLLLNH